MTSHQDVLYEIDSVDRIARVNEAWDAFAQENDSPQLLGEHVVGKSIWDFISDVTTEQIYRELVGRVRQGQSVRFHFRCDSAAMLRRLNMSMTQSDAGNVRFAVSAVSLEPRTPLRILNPGQERSDERVLMCGWCKRVQINGDWVEVEIAIETLHLLDQAHPPMLNHGICSDCHDKMRAMMG